MSHRLVRITLVTRRPSLLLAVVAFLALVAVACGGGTAATGTGAPDEPGAAVVERVVDGDTVRVRVGGRRESIRLIGVDTPESVRPGTPVECFAREAAARLRVLLPPGTRVRLERDIEARDRYGRLLAYVHRRRDGLFVNLALAREGYAQAATYPPNVAHSAEFVVAVAEARDAGRGLWARCPDAARPPPQPAR
jgi:micrococcal nuclease